jgi:ATP-binding cassette subfamily B protein
MRRKIFSYQLNQMDCGITCLRMVAKYYGKHYNTDGIRETVVANNCLNVDVEGLD